MKTPLLTVPIILSVFYFVFQIQREFQLVQEQQIAPTEFTVALLDRKYSIIANMLETVKTALEQPYCPNISEDSSTNVGSVKLFPDISLAAINNSEDFHRVYSRRKLISYLTESVSILEWSYFTSVEGFQISYPKANNATWSFDSTIIEREYFKEATPERNPDQKAFWTTPYLDSAGHGLMVTAGIPIYFENEFAGVLTVDLTLERISEILRTNCEPETEYALITRDRLLLAHSSTDFSALRSAPKVEEVIPGVISKRVPLAKLHTKVKGWSVYSFPVSFADASLYAYTSNRSIRAESLREMQNDLFIIIALLILITQVKIIARKDKELKELALYDKLTELPNRNLLFDNLQMEIALYKRNNSPFTILFLDLNEFKAINDTYGHNTGDATLKEFGKRLKETIRSSDTAGRLGGDEFIIIMRNCSLEENNSEIPRIKSQLNGDFQWQGIVHKLETSIGYATYPRDGDSVEHLIAFADKNMYSDKYQKES